MFEFGRDLRKLFAQARESEDLSWLELISVDLLAIEARQQTTDAGRVSCARPHDAWLRAAALWREHARRSGAADSLKRAADAAADAALHARTAEETARAAVETAQILLMRFDLNGGRVLLDQAAQAVPVSTTACRRHTVAAVTAVHARIRSRQARFSDNPAALIQSAALLDAAIHGLGDGHACEVDDLRMDRAALSLETGITRRDVNMLDQAGRELQLLVQSASPDYRPLTRARALTLCAAGLSALAALANDDQAHAQARLMFDAAADQFTADHSPLDWVVIQIVRAGTPGAVPLSMLRQAVALTDGQGLVMGALARDLLNETEIVACRTAADLEIVEAGVRHRLAGRPVAMLDWAVDQIAMARLAQTRQILTGADAGQMGLALIEASEVAREHGVDSLAERAEELLNRLAVRA